MRVKKLSAENNTPVKNCAQKKLLSAEDIWTRGTTGVVGFDSFTVSRLTVFIEKKNKLSHEIPQSKRNFNRLCGYTDPNREMIPFHACGFVIKQLRRLLRNAIGSILSISTYTFVKCQPTTEIVVVFGMATRIA